MNSNIQKLQFISLCQKVTSELENHIGERNKDLAEFIIDIAQDSTDINDFKKNLKENDGDFPESFVENIFRLINKMLPKKKVEAKKEEEMTEQQVEQKKSEKTLKFPGLAKQNDKTRVTEEIDLNIDLHDKIDISSDDDDKLEISSQDLEYLNKQQKRHRSRSRSGEKKKKSKKSKRSRSLSLGKKDKKEKKDKKDKKHKKHRSKSRESNRELIQGEIYKGIIKSVQDFGCFVQILGVQGRKEGLVHISEISREKIASAFKVVSINQQVYVRCVLIVNNKIKLSMKDIDQKTGKPIEKKIANVDPVEIVKPIEINNQKFGAITGINIRTTEDEQKSKKSRKRESSPEMWENKQIRYWSKLGITNNEVNVDESLSDEDEVNIELAEKEPLFLEGQTTKSGVILSPVRIIKNPEGSLNRASLNAVQHAKERRDVKEQQQRELMDQIDKDEIAKDWQDPNAQNKNLTSTLRTLANQNDIPDYKKEMMFKTQKKVNKSVLSMKQQREQLPIFTYKQDLCKAIKDNRVLIVIGETGSGKTTQMTQYLLESGFAKKGKKIGCTQPRRVAATSVAKRVAEEMGCVLGEEIGFTIRFEDCTSKNTIIKYMTDGMLLREALIDPDMNDYSAIMLDEAHERNLNTDILFGLLKKVVARRKDFTLIVTSATLDAEKFSSYFFDCKIFRIPGRTFPVEIMYSTEPEEDYLDAALIVVMQIHLHEPAGDILLFLTGQEEIDNASQTLHERMKRLGSDAPELIICPVYASLPTDVQNRIFMEAPPGSRKVVIATNIAEASLTIDGIFYVIDPGFAKTKVFNPKLGMDSLQVTPISQASARQRSGRAGRTGPGKCYRLYTENAFQNEMLPTSVPEIQRTNLANTVLLLKAMGINDLLNFDFMDPPPVQTLISALEQLYALGTLDDDGLLTKLGMKMAEFPLEPPLGKMLLTSVDLECSDEICTIIAMLSVQTIFVRPKEKQGAADQKRSKFSNVDGDHLTMLTVYEAWKNNNFSNIWCNENYIDGRSMRRAQDVRKQIIGILDRYRLPVKSAGKNCSKVRKAITAGFFQHAAKKDPQEGYKTLLDNHTVFIHPSSSLFNRPPEWIIYHELVLTSKEYMRNVTAIDSKWLIDVAPNFYQFSSNQSLNSRKRQEKLEPLQGRFGADPNDWRLSRR